MRCRVLPYVYVVLLVSTDDHSERGCVTEDSSTSIDSIIASDALIVRSVVERHSSEFSGGRIFEFVQAVESTISRIELLCHIFCFYLKVIDCGTIEIDKPFCSICNSGNRVQY